jgi:hypothetical protein
MPLGSRFGMKFKTALSGLIILLVAVSSSVAADRTETIRFDRGTTFKTLTGTIRGYDGVKYQVGATAGQVMSALFKPGNNACYMNVAAPGSETAIFNGSSTGNEYSGNLQVSGNYTIQVYLMRNAARRNERCKYSLTVEITGPTKAASPASGDALVPGTEFNATGNVPCARSAGQPMNSCRFGVVRAGRGSANVTVFWPDGGNRVIVFEKGIPASFGQSQADGDASLTYNRSADLFLIMIGAQRFEIPDAVVNGG